MMKTVLLGSTRQVIAVAAAVVLSLALTGCGDDDSNLGSPAVSPASAATRTNTRPPNTATATNTPKGTSTPTKTPTPTGTPNANVAGNYSAAIPLDSGQTAQLNVTVQANGQATGTLEVVQGGAASALAASQGGAAAAISLGFANISGSVNLSSGGFQFQGSITIGGHTTSFDISGTLPLSPGSTGSVTATINGHTYGPHTIGLGTGPTPLPTQPGGPSPTPIVGGCTNGVANVTFSNASGTNADTAATTFGDVTAMDQAGSTGTGNNYVWTIVIAGCNPVFGQVSRGIVLQAIAMAGHIQPGTYPIASSTPPFLGVTYTENKITLDPTQNFVHMWSSGGGTLVIEDAGGGALDFHATGVTMAPGLVFQGATGTFTLDISGTITAVTHY